MTKSKNVLVTGAGGPSGKAAMQALKNKGFRVIAVDMVPVDHCADVFVRVLPALDPAFAEQLDELFCTYEIAWFFPTVQEELVLVAERAAMYRSRGIAVYMASPAAVAICNDKWLTAQSLMAAGVAVPNSAIGDPGSAEVMPLGFPCISKPRIGRGGRQVVVHDGPHTECVGNNLVWQEFMPGTEYDVLLMIQPNQPMRTMVATVFEKTSLREGRTGNALEVVRVSVPDVCELALSAVKALNLVGPLDMDIRRDSNGVAHILEINARIGANTQKAPEIFDALVELYEKGDLGG
ncbi:ATP-grasp domain-containing protein [Glaciimonas soli]|uniref:ATP-grasp domain-containing protein n=1 Tax=Glaciimonas soli TaxID=2590999 RepID=A0A843YXH6_9BURK|nr:ATP-grasp domain-containing protein [Glaciimonas soli]MQR02453.1 ATP-grasp domain-containing protein [Glaciimonas soli]